MDKFLLTSQEIKQIRKLAKEIPFGYDVFNRLKLSETIDEYLIYFEDHIITAPILYDFFVDYNDTVSKKIDLLTMYYILVEYCQLHNQLYLDK
jgi:hypothetical protein